MQDILNARVLPEGGYEIGIIKSISADTVVIDFDVLPAGEESDEIVLAVEKANEAKRLETADAVALAVFREEVTHALNQLCKRVRGQFVTELPGQDMIYIAKEAEALSYLAQPDPVLDGYPLLAAEVGITAPSAHELAQIWANMGMLWRMAAAQIEGLRMATLNAISAAQSIDELKYILKGLSE